MSSTPPAALSTNSKSPKRFWLTVLCFALANIAAWVAYDRAFAARHRGTLRVESFEPGDGAIVGARPRVRWHFSADVIPTAAYGREPGRVTPTIAGQWTWDDPRTLVFTPESDLPKATHVAFALDEHFIRSDTGATLNQPYVTGVNAQPLQLEEARQSAAAENDRFVIELRFNDRVTPGDVLQHLTLTTDGGRIVHAELHGEAAGDIVRVITDPIPPEHADTDTALHVHLAPGLIGLTGPLGIQQAADSTVNLGRSLIATDLKAFIPARGQPNLLLKFNSDVDILSLKQILTIDPALPFRLESCDSEGARLLGDFRPGTRYTVKLAAAPAGADRNKFPRPGQLAAFMPDRGSGVWFDSDQGYLSTAGNRTLIAHVVNLDGIRVTVTRMYDNNLIAWRNSSDRDRWTDTEGFSKPIAEKTIKLPAQKNVQQDIRLALDDLLPATASGNGVYRVAVEPVRKDRDEFSTDYDEEDEYRYSNRDASAVVTLSDIGLTAKQTREGLVAWATSLRTAQPIANVRVRLFSSKNQPLGEATTNADGIATITGVHSAKQESPAVVLADLAPIAPPVPLGPDLSPTTRPALAAQLTWLALDGTKWDLGDADTNGRPYLRSGHEAFVYTDRGVYRPGETVHLRAIVRGPSHAAPATTFPVRWQIRRPDARDWKNYTVMLDADGAAALDLQMPADLPTGQWTALVGLPDDAGASAKFFGSATFQIEEFLPNRLKAALNVTNATLDRFTVGDADLQASVQGDYLFGRPAAGLPLELTTRIDRVEFHPDGWSGWTFGDSANVVTPAERSIAISKRSRHKPSEAAKKPEEAALDDAGHFAWSIDTAEITGLGDDSKSNQYRGPWRLTATAGVRELGGRAVTATKQIALDALPAYIGIHPATIGAAQPGHPYEMKLALVKPDGAPAAEQDATLEASLSRQTWNTVLNYRDGRYHYDSTRVLDEVQRTTVKIDAGHGEWQPTVPSSGSYVVSFHDPASGACSSIEFDANDGSPWDDNVNRENPEHVDLRIMAAGMTDQPNQTVTRPLKIGDTVSVLIASPFAGRLLLSVETDDVVHTTVLDMQASHIVVPVTITQACAPNAFISATVIRPIDPNAKWKTHRAFGVTRLPIDPGDHRLTLTIKAPVELQPLHSLNTTVTVTDDAGNPVRDAAVTVAAVDEGICSLTSFTTPDPLAFFTANRSLAVDSSDVFGLLMPEAAKPEKMSAVGGDADVSAARHHSPVVARRVKPVALAWAEIHTDDNGFARASFPVPEFQGKLRVMAVGYAKSAFGSTDQGVTVRSPILAQTTWPRFAAPGDRFTVPVVLFNNTSTAGDVAISVELLNDPATQQDLLAFVNVPPTALSAGSQKRVDLPVTVGQSVGVAKVRLRAAMNGEQFEENLELPIRPAAPSMQFGGYASASTTQPAEIRNVPILLGGTDSLRVQVTQWPTLQLPAGLDYLDRYPYGCVEQTTSSCFPLITLGDIGKTIDPVRFDPARIKVKIDAGITHLIGMQTADGGLAMWSTGRIPWPWGSVYAAHFLTEARAAGYDVPDDFYRHLLAYVRHLLDSGTDDATQLETQSYAAYVLADAGKIDRAILNRLTELTKADPRADDAEDGCAMRSDARLMLSCAWLLAGRRDLAEGLIPQTLPVPRSHRQLNGNIGSPVRDRALLIQTLLAVQPDHPALPDLVQQLADGGVQHQWASTQDTAFAVLAIGRYLRDAKKHEPYQSARLMQGGALLAAATAGEPITWTPSATTQPTDAPFTVNITGRPEATAHVSWLKTGVPLQPPADEQHGIKLHRRYLTIDDKELHGNVRSGDLVRVEITIEASPSQDGMVIEDLLPAGLEVENPRLETSTRDSAKNDQPQEVRNFGDSRLDVRDDRVIIVGSMPDAWKARCTYLARAVTPGVYVLPPVRAEQMYDININAISGAGGTLTVTSATAPNIASVHESP